MIHESWNYNKILILKSYSVVKDPSAEGTGRKGASYLD